MSTPLVRFSTITLTDAVTWNKLIWFGLVQGPSPLCTVALSSKLAKIKR